MTTHFLPPLSFYFSAIPFPSRRTLRWISQSQLPRNLSTRHLSSSLNYFLWFFFWFTVVRNKAKFMQFLNKRTATNPKRGPIHYRAPSRMFWRTVRGMIPHKTARGKVAMGNMQSYDGIPPPFDKMKRMVVPDALTVTRIAPGRKLCVLKKLASNSTTDAGATEAPKAPKAALILLM